MCAAREAGNRRANQDPPGSRACAVKSAALAPWGALKRAGEVVVGDLGRVPGWVGVHVLVRLNDVLCWTWRGAGHRTSERRPAEPAAPLEVGVRCRPAVGAEDDGYTLL